VTSEPRATVDVLVLGPVRARVDGTEVVPGGRRERGVLAALALAGPGGLDHDRLVDQLWGPSAPPTAHRTAQAYLSRLRSVLGAGVIRSEAGRHRLEADLVDLWEFDRLVRSARESPTRAPENLRDALALWRDVDIARDAALDGAADLFAAIRRSRLDGLELRLLHLDDREAVLGAEALLAEDPHRERAWAALASALYRLGRQAEALAAIRRARTTLREELGVDLSPDLERLEQELLRHGLSADAAPRLPTPLTPLIGREDLVDRVVASLDTSRLVTLVGTGGIGKTRVALAVAGSLSASGGLPVFVAELSRATGAQSVDDVLVEAVDASGEDVGAAFHRRFGRIPGLLVIDGCEHVLAAVAGRVDTLLRAAPGLRVLVTSRAALDLVGEQLVAVPPLVTSVRGADDADPAPAFRLFLDRAAEVTDVSSWSERDVATATEICRAVDGLPLALEVTARRLRGRILQDVLDDLSGGTSPDAVGAALDASYEALADEQQRAYARLGLLQGPVPLPSAAAVVGDGSAVEALVRASLLHASAAGVGMYQPVRQHAVAKLSPEELRAGRARIAEEVAALTARAAEMLVGADELDWLGRVDAVHGDVRAVLDWAAGERPNLVPRLVADVGYLWILGWSSREGRHWLNASLAMPTDDVTRVRLLCWSALVGVRRGELDRARTDADEALTIARRLDDGHLLGTALHARAVSDKLGQGTGHARELLQEAWVVRREAGDLAGAAMSLGAIADIDVNEGRLEDAAERYAIGLPLMRRADTAHGLVAYLHSMAELALLRGDPERALELTEEAQEWAVSTHDSWHLGLLASVRASAARDLGLPAREQWRLSRLALRAAADQPDPQVVLEVVEHVGGVLVDQDRHDDALRILRAARRLRDRLHLDTSLPRRVRRDADETAAAQQSVIPDLSEGVDLDWLLAAAEAVVE